ncbi:MAG TPA: Rieske 2Fe-2S domain-containing protein [Spongiibacteraceae bacterium]|jgi:nitrite reductase/ring-hydroxylating ferredoxin subunit|nr:Rieske 2Fe-2S domain-containing protein [Spongiibacteraceae bacterium]HUH37145.1 Rieske 2Fe-2S domain-containing protein [Spongiibacteraceae bacterium]
MSKRIPLPMPFGWFQVAFSADIAPGESRPLRYFDQDLVLFRTEAGEAKVLDAYCPHMGAHLGYGIRDQAGGGSRVKGDSIVCPFHGWAFNGEGQCTDVPYAKNLPPKVARGETVIEPWPVRELNQIIWVWYHPEGAAPLFEPQAVPEAEPGNGEWGRLKSFHWDIETHMQEIGENGVDAAHFLFVHGTAEIPPSPEFSWGEWTRGALLKTRMHTPKGIVDGAIDTLSMGPGQAIIRFTGICETILMANLTPVSPEHTVANYSFIQRKVNGKEPVGGVADAIVNDIRQQMEEDRIIWARKRYYDKPMLCDGDGPFTKFRNWYGKFLLPG